MKCVFKLFSLLLFFVFSSHKSTCQTSKGEVTVTHLNTTYTCPEPYELMHILFALTDTSIYAGNENIHKLLIDSEGVYYQDIMAYFGKYRSHPLVQKLNKSLKESANIYRHNLHLAYNTEWRKGKFRRDFKYPLMHRLQYSISKNIKRKDLTRFAKETNFEGFYQDHSEYYQQNLEKVRAFSEVDQQQRWLEEQFPARYDFYDIVVSPLMGGVHFTRRFNARGGKKCVMWVADARGYETNTAQNRGRYTGTIMTEIDHNYVNPVSDRFKDDLNVIMGGENMSKWLKLNSGQGNYSTGYKVFNEYMTHAVYLLYTMDKFGPEDQKVIENARISLMENRRKYYRFSDFYKELKDLYSNKSKGETIPDLYPIIIEWVKSQNQK
jgi:hypothetical protein